MTLVVLDQRRSLVLVYIKTPTNCLWLIVITLIHLTRAIWASLCTSRCSITTLFARTARRKTLNNNLWLNSNKQSCIKLEAHILKLRIKGYCLSAVAWEAIKNKTSLCIVCRKALFYQVNYKLIWNKLTSIHILFSLNAKLRLSFNSSTKKVTG